MFKGDDADGICLRRKLTKDDGSPLRTSPAKQEDSNDQTEGRRGALPYIGTPQNLATNDLMTRLEKVRGLAEKVAPSIKTLQYSKPPQLKSRIRYYH